MIHKEPHRVSEQGSAKSAPPKRRIAAPEYLFARPLIEGLDRLPGVKFQVVTPPSLADMLLCCQVDAALVPAVDLQLVSGLTVVPAGCVASASRTLTARIFSRVRPARMSALWTDGQAHTAVVLAQVLWSHCHNARLDIMPYEPEDAGGDEPEAVLLVGDKVVTAPPIGYDWQIDLGAMWHEMTGLPFVFAVWAASDPADCHDLYRILTAARLRGTRDMERIVRDYAVPRDWPADLASQYLTSHLQYDFGEAQREGMEEFFCLAADCGAIDELLPVRYYKPSVA